ncbi:hypothetical protein BY458DRAFT_554021 [Sporodiniella umbellata]|nr:hypothetical protein BY458DRAFT_554021 [Sporodiniella umbellata]
MTPHELNILIGEIVLSLDSGLQESRPFIKRVWERLDLLSQHQDRDLLYHAIDLWNQIPSTNNPADTDIIAMRKWKLDNFWQYMNITSSTLKSCLVLYNYADYDQTTYTEKIFKEAEALCSEKSENESLSSDQLKFLLRSYLYQSEYRDEYEQALLWYLNTSSLQLEDRDNLDLLYRKIASCYGYCQEFSLAIDYLEKTVNSTNEYSQDILLLVVWSIQKREKPELVIVWIDRLVCSKGFELAMFDTILTSVFQYGIHHSIIFSILGHILNQQKNQKTKTIESNCLFVIHLISVLRCIIQVKTTIYEEVVNDGTLKIKYLDFESISGYIEHVCRFMENQKVLIKKTKLTDILTNHTCWISSTLWNLGLYCLSVGKQDEGTRMFHILRQYHFLFTSNKTLETKLVWTFICICCHFLPFHETNSLDMNSLEKELTFLKENQANLPRALILLVNLFQIEFYVTNNQFELALNIFESDYPQNELYYIMVIAWNEGITYYSNHQKPKGDSWCDVSFELLKHYKVPEKKSELEKKMKDAYRVFTSYL